MYETYTENDQTESYYDESDLTSLCDDDINEHAPDTLLKRDVTKLYDSRKPFQVFRSLDGEELAHRSAQKFFIKYNRQIGKGGQGDVFLCEVETPYLIMPMTCVVKQCKVLNNDALAKEEFINMFKEFEMQRMLNHPGIVKTMYFLKRTKQGGTRGREREKELEFDILLEHMAGGNLQQFLNK